MRTPDEILTKFDIANDLLDDVIQDDDLKINTRDLMWEVLDDARDSLALVCRSAVARGDLSQNMMDEIVNTVDDYLSNNYGDD